MRVERENAMMAAAYTLSTMGTCPRRKVGAIITDGFHHIIGSGYNGSPRGAPHCYDEPCPGRNSLHGDGLDICNAIHAEQNALLQCKDIMSAKYLYTTSFPCIACFKMICNTGINKIYYAEPYPANEEAVKELAMKLNRGINFARIATEPVHGNTSLVSSLSSIAAGLVE